MIRFLVNDYDSRFCGCFESVVPYKGWLHSGFIINLYWIRIELFDPNEQ